MSCSLVNPLGKHKGICQTLPVRPEKHQSEAIYNPISQDTLTLQACADTSTLNPKLHSLHLKP